jgi:hypothetical protein
MDYLKKTADYPQCLKEPNSDPEINGYFGQLISGLFYA